MEPRRTALPPRLPTLAFMVMGLSFPVVFSQSFWIGVLPGGAHLVQPRWMAVRILWHGSTCCLFWPFLNSPCWWWLISSMFLTRTSCHKTTHANSYYGAWPGWAVSVSVLPVTTLSLTECLLQWERTWALLSPETRCVILVGKTQVLARFESGLCGFSPNLKYIVSEALFIILNNCKLLT